MNEWLPLRAPAQYRVRPHFSVAELACRCRKCDSWMNTRMLDQLERLRVELGHVMLVQSGYRCPAHNRAQRGSKRSYHQLGMAVDIDWSGWTLRQRSLFVAAARGFGFGGSGLYRDWVHIDTGPVRRWGLEAPPG